ncbi:MAG TPA: glycoside hydrolase family 95 protein [Bryobacteraceae bacterium]|jgi:alpha-L-fucosidase 2|nr:glycoside hydrolase family 95 protein [Bryobacteraceae bacterium]
MKKRTAFALAALALAPRVYAQTPLTLWYRQPAQLWVEALPVGNGHLGAMVFGRVAHERIQFNEQTVWTGEPHDYAHPGAYKSLPKIRELLEAGKQKEAEDLAMQEFMSVPVRQKAYQAFGDLLLDFPDIQESGISGYRRDLDLDTGVATTRFVYQGVTYTREVFASYPAKVIVVRLSANRPGSLTFEASLKSAHPLPPVPEEIRRVAAVDRESPERILPSGDISMFGRVQDSAIQFEARLHVDAGNATRQRRGSTIRISHADAATLILSGATNFQNYKDVSADPKARNDAALATSRSKSFDAILAEHIADHQRLFRRVSLDLGSSPSAKLPTDERIKAFAKGNDPALVALLFQFGRYLMIASSRPGGQPANLQGLWNDSNNPAWDSKYTDNINTEMNYWPAEETNLSECQLPLFDALKDLAASGAITAREHYNARGWVLHHNFDLWRGTAPINASNHGIWQTGGAWLSTHLWEHYLFTGDRQFLRDVAYPLMKGAAEFFVDTLVKDSMTGSLITGPSNSPEQGGLVMGPTMDRQIVRALFGDVIAAGRILKVDADFGDRLATLRSQIAPNQVGKYGQLQEWMEDKDDPKNQHRHMSHLWGVYPGSEITPYGTPDLFKAARQSLIFRGDAATGWSMGWKLNLWARFLDGDHAYRILQNLVAPASDKAPGVAAHAGLFANLFDAHPPFQIDGNFGATAGITEMLLQSDDPYGTPTSSTPVQSGQGAAFVHLLPALPAALPAGKVSGLLARGGLEVSIAWQDGKLTKVAITGKESKTVKVRYAGREKEIQVEAGKTYEFGPGLKVL